MQRLGKNLGGYRGECIDIREVLTAIQTEAEETGWHRDTFSILNGETLVAYHRQTPNARRRLYLSTGIHGDEPAGPLAILELFRENCWPGDVDLWLCPCLNLTGFPLNKRENAGGIDLNRDYRHLRSSEVQAHTAWLSKQPSFDLAVSLHEDWESNGFYLYELNPDNRPSLATEIIRNVAKVCPIETAELVDGWKARDGIIRPDATPENRDQWPESLFLLTHKTRQTYTFESPSDFPLETRVKAQITAVRTVLDHI